MSTGSIESASTGARTIVRLDHVSKVFGQVSAVDDISLDVLAGEFIALLGPSGCGKTTTLRMLAGFEVPTGGSIMIDGTEMNDVPPERRPVNTVFQHYALFPHMSVAENVGYGPRIRGSSREDTQQRVTEMLRIVRLDSLEDRRISQLSGGQAQRVALARALINRPLVLLLDEPLGALDLKLRRAMQLELRGIQQRLGITFVYVTHDQEEAMVMADRIVLMNDGRIIQAGVPSDLYHRPNSVFAAQFLGETNLIRGSVSAIRADGIAVIRIAGGTLVQAVVPEWARENDEVAVAIRPEGLRLTSPGSDGVESTNRATGVITGATYLGSLVRYVLAVDPIGPIIVDEMLGTSIVPTHSVGESVQVTWGSDSGVVLRSDA